ncbi:MAG: DUF3108 domain-containing protein [Planctomycetes bacterium]|nr:DUF3108 domain-containing protein [Planctomycetota bacterium]
MLRVLFTLFGALVCFTVAPAAPVPKHLTPKTEARYFPTRLGAESRYLLDEKDQGGFDRVTAVEEGDGETRATVNDGQAVWLVSKKGLFIARQGTATYHPPLAILKMDHVGGTAWDVTSETKGSDNKHPHGKFAAHGPEEVKVPTGTYRAIRVEGAWDGGTKVTFWFAPEVGLVKRVVKHANGGGFTQELRAFAPGK